MKKIIMNNRSIVIALMTLFTVAISPVVNATEKKPAIPAVIRFVGKVQNNPVFELTVPGAGIQEEYIVSVRDEHGNVLHVENIKAIGFTKKFMLSLDESNDTNYSIQFVITTKSNKKSALYSVNNNTRNIEEVVVTKL